MIGRLKKVKSLDLVTLVRLLRTKRLLNAPIVIKRVIKSKIAGLHIQTGGLIGLVPPEKALVQIAFRKKIPI